MGYKLPIPTVKRFPSYLRILKQEKEKGETNISATTLAQELGLKPIQVRKDLSCTGIEGKPKVGFLIDTLMTTINHALGWDNMNEAIIIGAGNLGKALACYGGFKAYGLRMVALFDNDKGKVGVVCGSLPVLSMEQLPDYITSHHIITAVITVPSASAQSVADELIASGIRAIWNFAPKDLKVPPTVVLQRTDLATSFAVLSVKLQRRMEAEEDAEYIEEEI